MKDKFNYYDFIANIIPGMFLVWIINSLVGYNFLFGNVITDSLIFIVLSYILGLMIQFFSKYLIESLVKFIFWKNCFFSEISLIKSSKMLNETLRNQVNNYAVNKLGIKKDSIDLLNKIKVYGLFGRIKRRFDKNYWNEYKKALSISNLIYRKIDTISKDKNIAQKAQLQNNYYSLFRGLSMLFILTSFLIGYIMYSYETYRTLELGIYFAISIVGFIVFFIRTKERGEHYIKGLFYSID
jgi:hypothetical protein